MDEPAPQFHPRASSQSGIMSWPEARLTINGELVAAEGGARRAIKADEH